MEQFKRAKVIILPTKEMLDVYKAPITKVYEDEEKLYLNKKEIGELITELGSPQHLYIISDDEIKENDYAYHKLDGKIIQVTKNLLDGDIRRFGYGKVTSTTDTSLTVNDIVNFNKFHYLPQPSKEFIQRYIESYNKGEIITDVLVEYNTNSYIIPNSIYVTRTVNNNIKVNPKDNTITIKKVKDNWNKEEFIFNLNKYRIDYDTFKRNYHFNPNEKEKVYFTDNWIKNNL